MSTDQSAILYIMIDEELVDLRVLTPRTEFSEINFCRAELIIRSKYGASQ